MGFPRVLDTGFGVMLFMVHIWNDLMCVNLKKEQIDLMQIGNRRFMYHPDGWLILGAEDVVNRKGAKLLKSHAEEYHEASEMQEGLPGFDCFIRGWIGVGGSYKKGIIHFAPHIPAENVEMFEQAFDFIEAALENGFGRNAVLRGFPGAWEQKIKEIIPEKDSIDDVLLHAAQRSCVGNSEKGRKEKEHIDRLL